MSPPDPATRPDVMDARSTATRLRIGIGAFRRRAQDVKGDGDVTAPQLAALSRLEREGPMTTAQLARREQITPQAMGATIVGLEQRGLVLRAPDPSDGRRMILTCAPAGLDAIREGRSVLAERIAATLDQSFSPDEIATLYRAATLLERLADHL